MPTHPGRQPQGGVFGYQAFSGDVGGTGDRTLGLTPARALAHCDGLDGPVVKAAQRALETRNPALVLIWVQEKDEREIQTALSKRSRCAG